MMLLAAMVRRIHPDHLFCPQMRNRDFSLRDVKLSFVISPIAVFLICLTPFHLLFDWLDKLFDPLPTWIELPLAFILVALILGPLLIFGILLAIAVFLGPLIAIQSFLTSNAEYSRPRSKPSKRLRIVLVTMGLAVVGLNMLILYLMDPRWSL